MTGNDSSGLNDLIEAASRQIKPTSETRPRTRLPLGALAAAVFAFGALGLVWFLVKANQPLSDAQVRSDLAQALDLAQQSVEASRRSTGSLPKTIPNASLAEVVQYEHDQSGYRLEATVLGVRVTMERDGTKRTETGVRQ